LSTSPPSPSFVKIRLLATVEATIELVAQLHEAGASLIAVHARHRIALGGQKPRAGPALLDQVRCGGDQR
jgi:tRNA-dihydrouridine synthase